MLVGFAYSTEFFMAWYSGNEWEGFVFSNRAFGPYWWAYTIMFTCNAIVPQVFWFKSMRRNTWVLFAVSILVNIGMWFERYVIVVTSLHRDFLPSSWEMYYPTIWDLSTFFGTIGLFVMLMFLFVRVLPMISIFEMRTLLPSSKVKGGGGH
jgi:molybdopterin-containing oxidoreductase family membrane subunit